ncbi:MAG: NAD-dependent epimerase/dehydratase family protein [Bacteroidota bacterium]|nr:NAD-dependent epimerase/dehydratase family protein [Bacteroidota bacterium]
MKEVVLVIGSSGQIGTELVMKLRVMYGDSHVVAADIKSPLKEIVESGPFEQLDIMDQELLYKIIKKYSVTQVYLLAALLSASAEKNIELGWNLNMKSLSHVLDLGKEKLIKKIYWPSSIAVFGPNSPKKFTPQYSVMNPNTVYGISKQAGERWCEYYYNKFKVDVRSVRYPGIIGWKSKPGGGTTDYAVDIFHEALENNSYKSFLSAETTLPMMYMQDAIRAAIELMEAPYEKIKIRSSYNIAGVSFNPKEISKEISKHFLNFKISYTPDYRQVIADGWPESIDDTLANQDWGWQAEYNLKKIVDDMIKNLTKQYQITH